MDLRRALFFVFLCLVSSCAQEEKEKPNSQSEIHSDKKTPSGNKPAILRNGKVLGQPKMQEVYKSVSLDSFDLPVISTALMEALEQQEKLLKLRKQNKNQRIGNLSIKIQQLEETIQILRSLQQTKPIGLDQYLEAQQIWGADRKGNVKFTGYYTPIIKVNKRKNKYYKYPIYDKPKNWIGPLPTRAEIEGEGALDTLNLELAYSKSKIDIYYMQVQGSGYVQYPNGKRELFAYNGNNRKPYRSIEKYILSREDLKVPNLSINGIKRYLWKKPALTDTILFSNPSYTFFSPKSTPPKGAGHVPLSAELSIAVDERYIPLGSCLLAAIPIYDKSKKSIIGHEYRFLLAQDVGGAIKGPGHVDLYMGTGEAAKAKAEAMHHFGQLWLLLPRPVEDAYTVN